MERLGGHRSPQELAEDFVRLAEFLKEPSPTTLFEQDVQLETSGIDLVGKIKIQGLRSVAEELAIIIPERAKDLLEQAPITSAFREHLLEAIRKVAQFPMMGFRSIIEEAGINLLKDRFGIFNPQEAQLVEKKAIKIHNPNPYTQLELARAHGLKMDRWIQIYVATYGDNPIES